MCVDAVDAAFRIPFPSLACKLVALNLAHHRNFRSGLCFVSAATVAEETGLDVRSVRRAIEKMSAKPELPGDPPQMIEVLRQRKGSRNDVSRYQLLFAGPDFTARLMEADAASDAEIVARIESGEMDGESAKPNRQRDSGSRTKVTPDPAGGGAESPEQEEQEESEQEIAGVDLGLAVDLIWRAAGEMGRKRSSKPKIEKALAAAIRRRPKSQTAEQRLELIMRGYRAYLVSRDATKDGGVYEVGAHRILVDDVWESHLGEVAMPREPIREGSPEAASADIGSTLNPGPRLQRHWAALAAQGLPWDEHIRGPRPGRLGCRVSPEIQRQFGFTPFEAPAVDDDAAAFD